jgi:hypothetical protein
MRLIATLLLTVLCFGLSAADFSAGDLTAIADKAKTMKVGEATSVKVMVNGKAVYVGLVMGASGLTVAGEGVAAGTYKFLYTDQGLAVQSTQAGQTKTMLVADGKVASAPADISGAFGAGAVSTWSAVKAERLAAAQAADQQSGTRLGANEMVAHGDLNGLTSQIDMSFRFASWSSTSNTIVPDSWTAVVSQNDSNIQAIITGNASGAQPN